MISRFALFFLLLSFFYYYCKDDTASKDRQPKEIILMDHPAEILPSGNHDDLLINTATEDSIIQFISARYHYQD